MSEATSVSGVAERYASALFELASETGAADQVAADMERFEALLKESADLRRLVRSPLFTPDAQLRAVTVVLDRAGLGAILGNFIKVAAQNRRLFAVPAMFEAYRGLLAASRGETVADVVSAEPLSAQERASLEEALAQKSGRKIRLTMRVDPSLLGGLIVKIGSRMIDSSLKTKLNTLKIILKEVG